MSVDEERKQRVIDAVIEKVKDDALHGDFTVLQELLQQLPIKYLIESLPEEEWDKYKKQR